MTNRINALIESATPTSAGELQVGPVVRATLRVNPADAEITPSDAVNVSTGTDIQMLWTWLVHPKRPSDSMKLTAFLEVPLENGHTISHELGFSIPVARTMIYTAEEVATHWATWSAVGGNVPQRPRLVPAPPTQPPPAWRIARRPRRPAAADRARTSATVGRVTDAVILP